MPMDFHNEWTDVKQSVPRESQLIYSWDSGLNAGIQGRVVFACESECIVLMADENGTWQFVKNWMLIEDDAKSVGEMSTGSIPKTPSDQEISYGLTPSPNPYEKKSVPPKLAPIAFPDIKHEKEPPKPEMRSSETQTNPNPEMKDASTQTRKAQKAPLPEVKKTPAVSPLSYITPENATFFLGLLYKIVYNVNAIHQMPNRDDWGYIDYVSFMERSLGLITALNRLLCQHQCAQQHMVTEQPIR